VSEREPPRRYKLLKLHIAVILAIGVMLLAAHGLPVVGQIFRGIFSIPGK
jgi:hypothetical protein